jgi:hypothetical protein
VAQTERQKRYYEKHRERLLQINKQYRQDNAEKVAETRRRNRIKIAFNITLEKYSSLLEKQGGLCAICKGVQVDGYHKNLAVDHDHETGEIRGLLCNTCNRGLGQFKDNINLMYSATRYLEQALER